MLLMQMCIKNRHKELRILHRLKILIRALNKIRDIMVDYKYHAS